MNTISSYWKWPCIVDFPINSMVIFHSFVAVYQRVISYQLWSTHIFSSSSAFDWLVSSEKPWAPQLLSFMVITILSAAAKRCEENQGKPTICRSFSWGNHWFYICYPLVMSTVCYWKWSSRNSWFTHENSMVIVHSYVNVYQRVVHQFVWLVDGNFQGKPTNSTNAEMVEWEILENETTTETEDGAKWNISGNSIWCSSSLEKNPLGWILILDHGISWPGTMLILIFIIQANQNQSDWISMVISGS